MSRSAAAAVCAGAGIRNGVGPSHPRTTQRIVVGIIHSPRAQQPARTAS
ncbi:hypothetical protein JOD63_002686 [Microbacterium terrae]|nr:hypothetical protein [Microbacterium terrae]MBP1078718.1 hypothetical protein [Microbacterium terrae]